MLKAWAIKHNVSQQALTDLLTIFAGCVDHIPPVKGDSESAVQNAVRLEAAQLGIKLFRNNVGALKDERGIPVRYGLANDSKALNQVIKSADLVGWRSIMITPEHVGSCIAQFVSRECKKPGWKYCDNDHERAQLAWAQLVMSGGGDATFCNGTGSF
jgi:hypothetical protein